MQYCISCKSPLHTHDRPFFVAPPSPANRTELEHYYYYRRSLARDQPARWRSTFKERLVRGLHLAATLHRCLQKGCVICVRPLLPGTVRRGRLAPTSSTVSFFYLPRRLAFRASYYFQCIYQSCNICGTLRRLFIRLLPFPPPPGHLIVIFHLVFRSSESEQS
jgi:hypothetical protein